MSAQSRRIRLLRGSANLSRVRGHTMAMAYEVQQNAMRAESEWAEVVRADERERIAQAIEAVPASQWPLVGAFAAVDAAAIARTGGTP